MKLCLYDDSNKYPLDENTCQWLHLCHFSYKIYDLSAESMFLLDLTISLCWERYKPCQFTANVFRNAMIPKRNCMKQLSYEKPGVFNFKTVYNSYSKKIKKMKVI